MCLGSASLMSRLTACAEDPMWADHAEVPKRLLREAVDALDRLTRKANADREAIAPWLGPYDTAAQALKELRIAAADILGCDPATWPDHGNVVLAIAAFLQLQRDGFTLKRNDRLAPVLVNLWAAMQRRQGNDPAEAEAWANAAATDLIKAGILPAGVRTVSGGLALLASACGAEVTIVPAEDDSHLVTVTVNGRPT